MLCEFRVKNYKSFYNETVLSMIAVSENYDLEYSLIDCNSKLKCLSSSAIYGPNASGKTNIVGSIDTFKQIVLRGNIENDSKIKSPNITASRLDLIPNNTLTEKSPVRFYIDFIEEDYRIQYDIFVDLGLFLDVDYKRKIITEELRVNGKRIFYRDEKGLEIVNIDVIKEYDESIKIQMPIKEEILYYIKNVKPSDLFLKNGFRIIISEKFVDLISNWFDKKLIVVYRSNDFCGIEPIEVRVDKSFYRGKHIGRVAKIFGSSSDDMGYIVGDDGIARLCTMIKNPDDKQDVVLPADIFESFGTIRMVNIFPIIEHAIRLGAVLIMDEFDASIHPRALINIVEIFHNDEINVNKAQLIFNTHNPIFLNPNFFRDDEIKFVEKDEKDISDLYSMSDFKSNEFSQEKGDIDYIKNYFIGRYGAVRDIDFSPIFGEEEV